MDFKENMSYNDKRIKIVDLVSEHEKWETYVSELREYLINRKKDLQL